MAADMGRRLEGLSRALAAALRHDRSCKGILPVDACRAMAQPTEIIGHWAASDVLLVAVGSRRDCGQRRFAVEQNDDGAFFIEAREKRPICGHSGEKKTLYVRQDPTPFAGI